MGNKEVTLNLYDTAGECACAPRVRVGPRVPRPGIPAASPAASLRQALTARHSWRPRRVRAGGWGGGGGLVA